jgi:dihydropteroate synthase
MSGSVFRFREKYLPLGQRTYIMGVLNVTPDSFSDGGLFYSEDDALKRAKQMLLEGADIIDIGGMSTRPGSEPVSSEPVSEVEELRRVIPVIESIRKELPDAIISVDTFRPIVAEKAMTAGADIINDVSGVFNANMAAIVKKYGAGYIVMHSAGLPSGEFPVYEKGVVSAVAEFFRDITDKLIKFGIKKSHICLDPGFGFAKGVEDNLQLLKNLSSLKHKDMALLVALSRKRFIGAITDESDPKKRLEGTLAANFRAVEGGADIIRVHDVKEHKSFLKAADELIRN